MRVALAILLASLSAGASRVKKPVQRDPRTLGLGRSCRQSKDCKSRAQRCLKMADMNGKPEKAGFCALPCSPLDVGTKVDDPGPLDPSTTQQILKKKAPPRCPPRYSCHGADPSTPIDICVKD